MCRNRNCDYLLAVFIGESLDVTTVLSAATTTTLSPGIMLITVFLLIKLQIYANFSSFFANTDIKKLFAHYCKSHTIFLQEIKVYIAPLAAERLKFW